MTHDQIREMVRRVNPIPDPSTLEIVDVPVLTTPLERRTEMQTDNREVTKGGGQNRRRGPLVGIATAAVILFAGLVFFLTRDNTPVAEPAPNATPLTMGMEFQPIEPGAYFAGTDLDQSTTLGGTFVIESSGWSGTAAGAAKFHPVEDDRPYIALLVAEVDQVWESTCNPGSSPQAAATTAEDLANQFVAAGLTITGALAPVSAFGQEGYHLTAEVPAGCHSNEARNVWTGVANWGGRYYQDEGQLVEYWFLDVEGTPVLVEASQFPDSSEEDVAGLEAVLDTLVLTP
jgi:hypothetical protein